MSKLIIKIFTKLHGLFPLNMSIQLAVHLSDLQPSVTLRRCLGRPCADPADSEIIIIIIIIIIINQLINTHMKDS